MVEFSLISSALTYGLLVGVIYGVMTVGLNIIFGVLKIVNVGHGAFVMIGAYITYWLFTLYNIPPPLSILLSLVIGLGLGYAFYYPVIRRIIGAPELATLLATFAIGVLLQETARILWSPDSRGFLWDIGSLEILGTSIPFSKLLATILALVIVALLYLSMTKTRFGLAVQAVVQDREGALVVGINVDRVYATSFALGIAITTISGSLIAIYQPTGINPYMGIGYTLKAFVIAVLGGLGSIWGAFIAGILFGLFENGSYLALTMIEGVQPLVLTRHIAFVLLLLILLIRPKGLFGR